MGGPPSFMLPAGDAMGEGTPDVCGDKSCIARAALSTGTQEGQHQHASLQSNPKN